MTDGPTVLGINRTQDGSVCLLRGQELVWNVQKERFSRVKRHWGKRGDLGTHYKPRLPELAEPVDLVVEGYSSDREIAHLDHYHAEVRDELSFRGEPWIERVSHHLSHLYTAFYPSPFDAAAVMVIDYQGSPASHVLEDWPERGRVRADHVEVASYFACRRGQGHRCLHKQFWDLDRERPVGLGHFYQALTEAIFPGKGNEGKVMGLAPYGRPGALGLPDLVLDGLDVLIPDQWLELLLRHGDRFLFSEEPEAFARAADLAATGQAVFERALLTLARRLRDRSGMPALCWAGGCALNCAANGKLLTESGFEEVFVPPGPHDGGTALGCALYGLHAGFEREPEFRWTVDYLGPEPAGAEERLRELASREPGVTVEVPADFAARVAELLDEGDVLGFFHGRSESGPRALGHRSILADPRSAETWRWINRRIKSRELYRPLAPLVRAEVAERHFEIDRPSPFMLFAVPVRPRFREVLGAVTHVDGTARIQTLERGHHPILYGVLEAFEARTGLGALLNTSFNRGGEPLVESPDDAFDCFLDTGLHGLAAPPLVLRKEPPPPRPSR